jgi:heptosyltransferase-2
VLLFHHLSTRTGAAKHAALVLATRAPVRAGLARVDGARGWFLTHRAPDRGWSGSHELEAGLAVAATVGAPPATRVLEFSPGAEAEARADALLGPGSRNGHVAIHPGTGAYSPARRWSAAGFAAVARHVAVRGLTPVLVGGPDDPGHEVAALAGIELHDLTARTDLATLGAVLARCRALVANDGGVMHMAAAVGTPTVAIFGPSNPVAWGPWPNGDASHHRVVALDLPCRPCFYVGHGLGSRHGCRTRDCLSWLGPEWVIRALDEVLDAGS